VDCGGSVLFAAAAVFRYHATANYQLTPRFASVTSFLRRRFWLVLGLCLALAAAILILMPGEKTLGWVIKIVYLHGALSRAGMIGLWAAGIAGAVYLIRPRPALARWTSTLLLCGWGYWAAHFIVSMPATRLTWGPWIAWGEPRVTMTMQVLVAGLVVVVITRLLKDARFTAAAAILLAVAVAFLIGRTGVLRHPLDPIGTSPSTLFRLVYLLLLAPVVGSMFLIAWRLAQGEAADAAPITTTEDSAGAL
jgi:hypothetical protein